MKIKIIAHIKTPFNDKFGIPRQSGMVDGVLSEIIFTPEYRNKDAVRGLDGFSHLWVLWEFSEFKREEWSPTVRPPRLGGNKRMGVFATRSPNRPNPIGMSSVKIVSIDSERNDGPVITVSGADMMNGTPIYDIKPYIPFTDSHPEASMGFAEEYRDYELEVFIPKELEEEISKDSIASIRRILSLDPRPSYQRDAERVYGVSLYEYEIKFRVCEGRLSVISVEKK